MLDELKPQSFYETVPNPENGTGARAMRPAVAVAARQLTSECSVPEDKLGLAFHLVWAAVFGSTCPERVPVPESFRSFIKQLSEKDIQDLREFFKAFRRTTSSRRCKERSGRPQRMCARRSDKS